MNSTEISTEFSTEFIGLLLKRPKYIDHALKINDIIPWIENNIVSSEIKMIIISKKDFAKELKLDISEVESLTFGQDLKFILLMHGIVIKNGVSASGEKLFIMRMATHKDKMPKYWRKRSRFFKRLTKSKEWHIMLQNRDKPYVTDIPYMH